jgi:hypothetical protein
MKIQYLLAFSKFGLPIVGAVFLLHFQLVAVPKPQQAGTLVLAFDGFMGTSQAAVANFLVFEVGFDLDDSL